MLRSALRQCKSPSFARALNTFPAPKISDTLEFEEEKYSTLLQKCVESTRLDHGEAIHGRLFKESLQASLFLHNHLLNMYMKCGDLVKGLQVFEEMRDRNVVSWSAIIAGFVQHGCPNEALSLFCRMHRDGLKPNEFTLVSTLNACSLAEDSSQAYQIYACVVRLGFESNVYLINAFLSAMIRHKKLVEAVELFEKSLVRDIVSWNAMIAGYLQFSYSDVPGFWWRMNHEGVKPDNFTFATVLTGLAASLDLIMGLQVHAQLVKYGYADEVCVGNALVDMYLKNRNLMDGSKAFHEMPHKDMISWTQMAAGCLQCGEPNKVLPVIQEMMGMGLRPNKFTLATAINACANLASLEEGKKAHGLRIKLGNEIDVCVDNALLDMYAKCGFMDGAWRVFWSMNDRSVVSWTTMIMGFAQNGYAREALEIFDKMRSEGAEPNCITFICVLYACSQGGLINEGLMYFSSMSRDYGIEPGEDHYACMVDLLGRSGQTKEAEALILSMPFQPSALVWQTLLNACRIHGDQETGLRSAERALALDKQDPSIYVMLSNIFADSSNWDGVEKLREVMETRDLKKTPGCSWIESNGNQSVLRSHRGYT